MKVKDLILTTLSPSLPSTPKTLAKAINRNEGAVKMALKKLMEEGKVKRVMRGGYVKVEGSEGKSTFLVCPVCKTRFIALKEVE